MSSSRRFASLLVLVLVSVLLSTSQFSSGAQRPGSGRLVSGIYDNAIDGSPVLALINSAQSTLDIEIYEMDDPKVLAAIRAAIKRGVTVHIVKEPLPVGGRCKVFGDDRDSGGDDEFTLAMGGAPCEDQKSLVAEVNRAGGRYVPFAKPELCGGLGEKSCLEHGKIVIADARWALVTSGNLNTTNLCDKAYGPKVCNRDYTYLTDDRDVVRGLYNVVERDLLGRAYDVETVLAPGYRSKMTVGPNSLDPLVDFIKSARRNIIIQNQYLKEPKINAALIQAARSGIAIRINVASACSFGRPKPNEAKRIAAIYSAFDQAGIKTRMFTKNIKIRDENGYLHAKAIIVDGTRAWMGSVNGSTQATTLNREFGVFFDDVENVRKLNSIMQADFAHEAGETWQESLDCAEND